MKHVVSRTSDFHIDIDLITEPKHVLAWRSFEHTDTYSITGSNALCVCWRLKCNNCPKCNKVLNVIPLGLCVCWRLKCNNCPKCNKVLNVIPLGPKCNKPPIQSSQLRQCITFLFHIRPKTVTRVRYDEH